MAEIPRRVATSCIGSPLTLRSRQTSRSAAGSRAIPSASIRSRSLRAYQASGFSLQRLGLDREDSFRIDSHSSSGTNLPDCLRRVKSIAELAVTRINQERKSPLTRSPVNKWSFVKAFSNDSWQTSSASSTFRVNLRANRKSLELCGATNVEKEA